VGVVPSRLRHPELARGGVQGGEQLVGGIGAGHGEGVEQGGLAGVGVAHQGHREHAAALPAAPLQGAGAGQLVQPGLDGLDALGNDAPVQFQLGFAGAAAHADAALLPLQVGPAAHQAGGVMAQLGQFHLQLALVAARAQGEDIQDQGGAVQHPALQPAFQVALLNRGQLVIEDHQGSVRGPGRVADLVGLAGAREQGRASGLARLPSTTAAISRPALAASSFSSLRLSE
jgi:hypothetical protein